MDEVVAAADPLQDFASVQVFQPADKAQGDLVFLPETEAEEIMLQYRICSKADKTQYYNDGQDKIEP